MFGTVESNRYLEAIAEHGNAARMVVGVPAENNRPDIPRDRRDIDRDRDTDSDSDADANAGSSSSSDSRSESSVTIPDKIKTEITNDYLPVTGTVGIGGPVEIQGPITVTLASLTAGQGITETSGVNLGIRPEPPDLRDWRWWPWLALPAVIAGGLAGLGAFLGGAAGRRAVVVHEDTHHAEGTRRTTTRRETRRTEGVAEGTAEGARTRATRETRETREETRETAP